MKNFFIKKSTILKRLLSAITIMVLASNSWLTPEKIYASSTSTEVLDSESYGSESKSVTKDKSGDYVQMFDCKFTVHEHTEECYDDTHNIICGKADFVVHTHDKNCYNSNGRLVCKLPEIKEHTHDETCYGGVEDNEEEQQENTGEEDIGDTVIIMEEPIPLKEDNLTCKKKEIQLHTHTMICLDENGNLVCGKLEILSHQHTEACFKTVKKVTKSIKTSGTEKQQTKSETITNTILEETTNTQNTESPDTEETKPESGKPFWEVTIIWIIILILAVALISRCIIYRKKRRV
jgi:hypothetical protein